MERSHATDTPEVPKNGYRKERRVVLLVGRVGSGKSALGNFLVDPEGARDADGAPFRRGNTNRPETKEPAACPIRSFPLARDAGAERSAIEYLVVDTPGMGEPDPDDDVRNLRAVLGTLDALGSPLAAVLVCVRHDARIDAALCSSFQHHARVLGPLLRTNAVLVLTGYREDAYARALREDAGIDPHVLFDGLTEELSLAADGARPPVVAIDSLPRSAEGHCNAAIGLRRILELVADMQPTPAHVVRFAKTPAWARDDADRLEWHMGALEGSALFLSTYLPPKARKALSRAVKAERVLLRTESERADVLRRLSDAVPTATSSADTHPDVVDATALQEELRALDTKRDGTEAELVSIYAAGTTSAFLAAAGENFRQRFALEEGRDVMLRGVEPGRGDPVLLMMYFVRNVLDAMARIRREGLCEWRATPRGADAYLSRPRRESWRHARVL